MLQALECLLLEEEMTEVCTKHYDCTKLLVTFLSAAGIGPAEAGVLRWCCEPAARWCAGPGAQTSSCCNKHGASSVTSQSGA
ncbi:hypothetical protein HaLaN_31353 [Haematococcus lacustris]|uniref:Uncharacterized protein n=1 Tax=Haematococcus lacustris TaxID=44745 RepID=A0A6A0AHF2_HAELA|nr:hypothetical protein HaLaN_31353 [Haematococcus lacustris]